MQIDTQADFVRPLIPAGEHVLTLKTIEKKRVKSKFAETEDGKVEKLVWSFAAVERDEEGEPYEYTIFTGLKYGNEKAALTELLNSLVPEMDENYIKDFDTSEIEGKRFEAMIRHQKGDGDKVYAKHLYIMPYKVRKRVVEEEEDAAPAPAEKKPVAKGRAKGKAAVATADVDEFAD